jgi:hypothetical protein
MYNCSRTTTYNRMRVGHSVDPDNHCPLSQRTVNKFRNTQRVNKKNTSKYLTKSQPHVYKHKTVSVQPCNLHPAIIAFISTLRAKWGLYAAILLNQLPTAREHESKTPTNRFAKRSPLSRCDLKQQKDGMRRVIKV